VELRQIRSFVAVAGAGSFGRAADELHVAKSALSKHVKLLEAELGAQLFVRGGGRRTVVLTEAGDAFLPEAVTIVKAAEEGKAQVRALSSGRGGRATLLCTPGWEAWPGWEHVLAEFRRLHSGISVSIGQGASAAAIADALAAGTADIGIVADLDVPEGPGLAVDVLHREALCVVLPPKHRLAEATHVSLADLRAENWLLPPVERQILTRLLTADGFAPQVEIEAPTPAMVRAMVIAGEGIGILGASERPFYAPAATPEITPQVQYAISLLSRAGHRGQATRAVRDFLRTQFGVPAPTPSAA
jgi:DNA-binding transcriptional LysR family regulator